MRKSIFNFLGCMVSLMVLTAAVSRAQVETGQIAGTVSDQAGAMVSNATVTVKNLATSNERSVPSSANGAYIVIGLEPAIYQLTVTSPGFKPFSAKVEVTVGSRVTLNAKLEVGAGTTEVVVIAEGGSQINTDTQEISQVVSSQEVMQLPSLTRNPYDFIEISGNVSNGDAGTSGGGTSSNSSLTPQNSQNATLRGAGFNINGQRSTGTEILLDGVENVEVFSDGIGIFIPLDAMQEFRVSTSNYEPKFGRASGGVVNVTTKSGTNTFHGDVWEENRLSAYTANTETNDQEGAPKGTYTRNQFGFVAGGPVMKNKLFLFGGAEWIRVRSSAVVNASVPTPQFLALAAPNIRSFFTTYGGSQTFNFNQTYTALQVYGTDTSGNYAGPAGLPPSTPTLGNVVYHAPENAGGGIPQSTYNYVIRGDYTASEKTQLFYRFVAFKEVDLSGADFASPYSQFDVGGTVQNMANLLSISHQFKPSLSSNTKLSFSRLDTSNSYNTSLQNDPTLFVYANVANPANQSSEMQLPGFYDTNPANGGLPYGGPHETSQINEDINWLRGKHSLEFGTQLLYIQENNAYGAYAQANEELGSDATSGFLALFNGSLAQFTAAVSPKGAFPCIQNQYTGNYTQTAACSITLPATSPSFARSDRFKDWAFYAQDSWKVTPRLTGNYGVRYEYYGIQHNDNPNLDSNFYYGAGKSIPLQIRSGQVFTVPNSPIHKLWNPQYGTIAPRIGFAYDLFGNGRDSIRGGYGIAYERNFGNVSFNVIQNPPNYAVIVVDNVTVTNSNAGPLGGSSGSVALPPTSLRNVDENIRAAQTQFWSLALEHQLTRTSFVSLQYVGARGTHLYDIKNYNGSGSGNVELGDPNVDPVTKDYGLTRLNDQYSNINNRGSNGDSYYHGGNIQFQTTNWRQSGLSLVANYTLAHQMDDLSTAFSETNGAFSLGYTNPFNPGMDRGNGDLDIRQRLVIAPIYDEPFFKSNHGIMGEAAGGWELAGVFVAHTGTPFNFYDSTNHFSVGYNYPRYTPDSPIKQHTFKSIPSGAAAGVTNNTYTLGKIPGAVSWGNPNLFPPSAANPTQPDTTDFPLGISDWGPWPKNMISRNSFRGPGLWGLDLVLSKTFPIHDKINAEFRAEGFNILNHHNLFLQESSFDIANPNQVSSTLDSQGTAEPIITASKGGIGNNGGANDERRFGQFALKVNF
jgi:hypothetical protein